MNKYAVWTKRDGSGIAVRQMTDEHLINTIRAMQEGRIGFQDDGEQQAWLTVLKAEALQRGRSWEDPAFDKVGLVSWVLGSVLGPSISWRQYAQQKALDLLKQHGIEEPLIDVSRYSGKPTYQHWETGEGKGKPTRPVPQVGDPVEVDIPGQGRFKARVTEDPLCSGGRISVTTSANTIWWVFPEQITVLTEGEDTEL